MRQYSVTIRVFSEPIPYNEDITFCASDLRELDSKLHCHADQYGINFDIVSIHAFRNHDYNPLPF